MGDDCFGCRDLYLYSRTGGKVVFEAIRSNVLRHGDIGLKLCLFDFSLRAVELLDVK